MTSALRLAILIACLMVAATAHAQTGPAPRPILPPPAPAPALPKSAFTLSAGGLGTPITGLQSFAANGSFLKGLNPADPAPQCRARCGSDRAFCGSGGGDDSCDRVWRQCLTACRGGK